MSSKEKIVYWLEYLIPVLWGFVAGIGIGIIGYSNEIKGVYFVNYAYVFLILSIFFLFASILLPSKIILPNTSVKRLCLVIASFNFGIFWYLNTTKISSPTHLLAVENGKYKFIDTDISQTSIIYGTIVADPDIREDATNIIIRPEKIIPNPNRFTIEVDTTATNVIIEKDFVVDVIDGDTFVTKNGQKIRLLGVNAPEIGQHGANEATEFLKQKVLNKEVELIIQQDYIFDIYDRILAVVIVDNENINKLMLDKNLAVFYDDPNVKIIKKIKTGDAVKILPNSGLIRAKVLPTIGDYYFQMSYGDYVKIVSPILLPKKATNPAGFDYRKYLNVRGIYAVTKTLRSSEDIEYLGVGNVNIFVKLAFLLRRKMLTTIRKTVPYPQSAFLGGVTLGYRGGVPQKIREQFQATGVAHVLALSGLHTGFIAALLLIICNIFRVKSLLRFIFVSIALSIFVVMTGASPATIRSALMFCIGLFFYDVLKLSLLKSSRMTIIIAACVMLFFNPKLLPDASFVLSFMAVWSLIYVGPVVEKILLWTDTKFIHQFVTFPLFSVISGMTLVSFFGGILQEMSLVQKIFPVLSKLPSLNTLFPQWFNIPTSRWLYKGEFFLLTLAFYICGVVVHYIYSLSGKLLVKDMRYNSTLSSLMKFVAAQVAIQLGMMWPLSSVYFYRFPISGFYANFLAIPLIGWIVQLGWIAGLVDLFFSILFWIFNFKFFADLGVNIALVINAFNNQLCQMFLGMAKTWGEFVPYPYVEMFAGKSLALWYFVLGVVIWFDKIKELVRKYRIQTIIIVVIIILFSTNLFILGHAKTKTSVDIVFFDIGFGNAVLIRTPTKNILVDTGPSGPSGWSPAESAISPTLTYYKIKKLDAVILTSLKPQCIGGAVYILSHFNVSKVYLPANYIDCSNFTYYDFIEKVGLWYYMSNPYQYEITGLFNTNYRLSKFINNYKNKLCIMSSNEETLLEEKIGNYILKITIINAGSIKNTTDEIGNNSLILKISYGKNTVLLTPQAGFELQNVLVSKYADKLKSQIMLVPANGHPNMFNEKFVGVVNPEIAVCQYGWTNQRIGYFYSSQVDITQKLYELLNIKFLRTDKIGAVIFSLTGESYKYRTGISEEEYKLRIATEVDTLL